MAAGVTRRHNLHAVIVALVPLGIAQLAQSQGAHGQSAPQGHESAA